MVFDTLDTNHRTLLLFSQIFRANGETNCSKIIVLPSPIRAECIRVVPTVWFNYAHLRLEVMGCQDNGKIRGYFRDTGEIVWPSWFIPLRGLDHLTSPNNMTNIICIFPRLFFLAELNYNIINNIKQDNSKRKETWITTCVSPNLKTQLGHARRVPPYIYKCIHVKWPPIPFTYSWVTSNIMLSVY